MFIYKENFYSFSQISTVRSVRKNDSNPNSQLHWLKHEI